MLGCRPEANGSKGPDGRGVQEGVQWGAYVNVYSPAGFGYVEAKHESTLNALPACGLWIVDLEVVGPESANELRSFHLRDGRQAAQIRLGRER